ncbi:hypothetical protein PAUR_a0566 [Pseudoalteromonas aurantia 208]|uniref:Uncharacterized protein n=1 Tax=Pseudoalteromonas aurantia 208 TaxID=1314867 RepID=A0ABR9E8C1_9GAMM|nr:hypothetical protein [Pseudoalteromonas aurantia 208]
MLSITPPTPTVFLNRYHTIHRFLSINDKNQHVVIELIATHAPPNTT